MHANGVKALWKSGKPAINGWLSIASSFGAEIMAEQGFDSLTVDQQHGALDYSDLLPMLQALRASGVTPMVRVPWLDSGDIMKALDAGAYGIICPMISTADQAAALVQACRYPPLGTRSFGPTRVGIAKGPAYYASANDEVLVLAMIETAEAMENLEAIVATPGLDGVYVGPADLTLGVTNGRLKPGFDREEPEMIDVIQQIVGASKAAGIRAALHCGSPGYAAKAISWGYDLVTLSNDVRILAAGAADLVKRTRAELAGESGAAGGAGPGGSY